MIEEFVEGGIEVADKADGLAVVHGGVHVRVDVDDGTGIRVAGAGTVGTGRRPVIHHHEEFRHSSSRSCPR